MKVKLECGLQAVPYVGGKEDGQDGHLHQNVASGGVGEQFYIPHDGFQGLDMGG